MKVNNLLKRIGSVVTTAAMLATLGTTGFAADPTPYDGSLAGNKITITNVTRDDTKKDEGIYGFTISYDSGSHEKNSIGVTMLAYVYNNDNRNTPVSVGDEDNKTAYNPEKMQIVGVNQEKQAAQSGTIKFAVATSENATGDMVMKPGQQGLVMIGGDNTTPAIAKFSIPAVSWTIASAEVKPNATLADKIEYGKDEDVINTAVYNYITGVEVSDSKHSTTLTKKTGATKFDGITIKDSTDADYVPGKVGNFIVTIPLSNFVIPADSGATIGTVNTVTVGIEVDKDSWTATNATVGNDNKISVAKGTTDIATEIKKNNITIDNGVTGDAKKTYTLSSDEMSTLEVKDITTEGSAEDTKTYEVSGFAGKYESEDKTAEITVKEGLKATVTVTFTQNVASAVELVNGNTESATAYTWNKDNVSVKSDADDAKIKDVVKNKLAEGNVYAKITYTNPSISNGDAQYKYVKVAELVDATSTTVDKTNKEVTVILPDGDIFFPTDGENKVEKTLEFGYTVTPVLDKLELSATTYNYTKQADVEEPDTIKANIITELDKLTITEDAHTVNVADTEHTWTITFGDNGTYTAILKVTKFNDTTFDAWMPTAGYIEATVTGTISEKPAEAFTAKSFGADDKEVLAGTTKEKVIEQLPKKATAYAEEGQKGAHADVDVKDWTSSDYDETKGGTYTFTATVPVQTKEGVVKVTEAGTVSVTVKTKPNEISGEKTVTVNVPEGYTAETVANALPENLTYTSGTLTDTVDVTWTAINDDDLGKADSATFTVNGTVNDESDNHIFKFNSKAVKATVTVRNSVESNKAWELGNTGEYNAGTVKVYLPTTAKKDGVVIATLYKADGTTLAGATATVTLTSDYNADTYNSVDLTFDKSFNAAGINANDKYTVKVTVAGTPLVYKDAENKDADSVQGTVYPTTSRRPSTGGGSTTPEVKSYNVSVKADNNGKATVNKTKATAGETVAVNVEPNEGYKVKEITVKDVNGKSIDVDQKTRTFEMPAGAVTVTVTFEEGTEEPTPDDKGKFKDVPDSFWAAADIYTLREAGIIDGKTADEFDPEGQVTRAEFTKMIVKMFGVEAKDTKVEFADCGEDDWFTPFVAAAVEAGYVKGYSDTEFAPDKVISREEACAILGRAYAKAANSELSFTDKDSIDEYAQPYVALLVEMGFINGYEDGTFRAQNHITRAEAAKIIGCAYRLATASK